MLQKDKKMKEKKWWNVPKVPPLFWRTSMPPGITSTRTTEDEATRKTASLDAKEAAKAKLTISNPRPVSSTYVPSKTIENIDKPLTENLYVNEEAQGSEIIESQNNIENNEPEPVAIYSEPVRKRPVVTNEENFEKIERKQSVCMPNICFSFFNDGIVSSTPEANDRECTESSPIECSASEIDDFDKDSLQAESEMKLKQSSILLEVRQEKCDGTSSDNIRIIESSKKEDEIENKCAVTENVDGDYAILKRSADVEYKMAITEREEKVRSLDYMYSCPKKSRSFVVASAPSSVMPLNGVTDIPDNIASGIFSFPSGRPSPEIDWDSLQYDSDYTYYELTHGGGKALSNSSTIPDNITDRDYEDLEYCEHRAKDPRNRRATLIRKKSRHAVGTRVVSAKSRIGKAWRAVRIWWSDEKERIEEVIQKHAHAQAVKKPESELEQEKSMDNAESEDLQKNSDKEKSKTEPKLIIRRRRGTNHKDGSRPSPKVVSRRSKFFPEGQSGFEELRRYIKQGGDFCKDLSSILQERSEAETQYAKSLSKLSGKLLKASKDSVGTVNQAWQKVGAQMEAQSEIHRAFAAALSEEVVKPLKQLVESQHRIRKSVESAVEKTSKGLGEWRTAEAKSKKQSFMSARENEKLQDAMLDVRLGRSSSMHHLHHIQNQKTVSDKECAKLETKRRKAEESVKKADVEYYTFCIRAERARLEWETAVIRGSHCFQALEEERLQYLKDLASCYLHHLSEIGPKLVQSTERLSEPVNSCDIARDIQTVVSIKGTGQPIPEQLLPDFYAEHITLAMNRERRRQALMKLLQLIRQDLDRERRGKQGVENLARALQQTPTFGAEDSQQNVTEKLHHMRSMLTYLEAARYKVQSALAELDGRSRGSHPLASHIEVTRDRQGLQQSVLKVPPWVRKESIDQLAGDSPDWTDRGAADGNSVQPDSDFDEFSSQGSEKDYQSSIMTYPVISECAETNETNAERCKVLYQYSANHYDELNLSPGDVINIHNKQADGWWIGELNGVVGIFPATYVEEVK